MAKGSWVLDTAPFMMIFVIFVGALFIMFMVLVGSQAGDFFKIPDKTEDVIFKERFLTNCFNNQDELSGRNELVIDKDKFTQEKMNECYDIISNSKYFSFRLSLGEETIETRNWRGSSKEGESLRVLVLDEGEFLEENLLFEAQDAK